jgi:hypothetical protein
VLPAYTLDHRFDARYLVVPTYFVGTTKPYQPVLLALVVA